MNEQRNDSAGDDPSSIECSIIIPTRDKLEYLQPCIDSLFAMQANSAFEIVIVDNESQEQATRDYLKSLSENARVRILNWNQSFNFSAINNFAAEHCEADVICFLNNDIEAIHEGWLDQMLAVTRNTEVGAVGCLLLYPDKSIQHAGIALDQVSVAKHIAVGEARNFLARNGIGEPFAVDATTGACLMIGRDRFQSCGGFNAQDLAVSYNDVDLCLRLKEQGLTTVLHPGVCLVHHESVSRHNDKLPANRTRARQEFDYMQRRWRQQLHGRQYESGLPDQLTRHRSLETAPASKPLVAINTANFLERIEQLEQENQALQDHVVNIEEAHRLIEQSWFWRVTAPLRFIRELLLFRSRPASAGADSSTADDSKSRHDEKSRAQLLEFLAGDNRLVFPRNQDAEVSIAGADSSTADDSKSRHDEKSRAQLLEFLAGDNRLVFPRNQDAEVSIILVFYNQAHLSYLCLQSLLQADDIRFEVVIVDNNSTDETAALLQRIDNARIHRNDSNQGFVKAVNLAAELASGHYLLLLNNDAMLEGDALSAALNTLQSADDIGAVGAKIKLLDGSLQEAGSIIWNDGACTGYGRGEDPEAPEFMMRRDVDYCSGAFLLMETRLFRETGCFDEAFAPAYYEESDFCIRLHELGYRVVYEPRAQITHYEFASSGGLGGATRLQQEHREILCEKHPAYLAGRQPDEPRNTLHARSANAYPNVLVIDDRVPFPSLGAGYPRCFHILNTLAQLPINLTFYPLLFPQDEWNDVYELLNPSIEVMLGQGKARLQDFLRRRKGFYQTIMVSRVDNMAFFNDLVVREPDLIGDEKIIYDAEAISASREVLQRRLWGEQVTERQKYELVSDELRQARTADQVVAVSHQEAALYHQHGLNDTIVLGHTLPIEPTANSFEDRSGILFVGALRDEGSPNVDSLLWFLINCLPTIEQQIPGITFYVVGDNSVPSLTTVARDNVIFTGRLDAIETCYNDCRLFVAPTRFAAGIPHKIHEAASNGLPTVATSLLARQLNWINGEQLLIADSADDFISQCVRLYTDESLWQQLRENGLKAVEKDCSQEAFQAGLMELFDVNED